MCFSLETLNNLYTVQVNRIWELEQKMTNLIDYLQLNVHKNTYQITKKCKCQCEEKNKML